MAFDQEKPGSTDRGPVDPGRGSDIAGGCLWTPAFQTYRTTTLRRIPPTVCSFALRWTRSTTNSAPDFAVLGTSIFSVSGRSVRAGITIGRPTTRAFAKRNSVMAVLPDTSTGSASSLRNAVPSAVVALTLRCGRAVRAVTAFVAELPQTVFMIAGVPAMDTPNSALGFRISRRKAWLT